MKQRHIIHSVGTLCLILILGYHLKDFMRHDNKEDAKNTTQSIYNDTLIWKDNSKTTFSISGKAFRAFDPTFEGQVYEIPKAVSGEYEIPYTAIEKGTEIDVDNAVIFFVDELKSDEFNNWFHNTELYNVLEIIRILSEFEEKSNCKVGYLISEGRGTGFSGDGTYTINLEQLRKVK